jgi:histone H3/H4
MSNLPTRSTGELQRIIERADIELQAIDPTPFSPNAFECLKEKISEYSAQLVTESVKVARRRESETVSTKNVEQASQYLVSSSGSKFYRNIGTLGGILLGAGLSTFLSMVTAGVFTTTAVLIALTLTVVGMFMVALQIAKD